MTAFGQKLIDKAKSRLKPKSKWVFDTNSLQYVIKDGKDYNKSIRSGKIKLNEEGMEFIDDSKSRGGFTVDDYDSLHLVNCRKDKNNYLVTMHGRKIKAGTLDDKKIQDPMEALIFSKANRSDLTAKNLLVITVKSVDLGKFHDIEKDEEVAV